MRSCAGTGGRRGNDLHQDQSSRLHGQSLWAGAAVRLRRGAACRPHVCALSRVGCEARSGCRGLPRAGDAVRSRISGSSRWKTAPAGTSSINWRADRGCGPRRPRRPVCARRRADARDRPCRRSGASSARPRGAEREPLPPAAGRHPKRRRPRELTIQRGGRSKTRRTELLIAGFHQQQNALQDVDRHLDRLSNDQHRLAGRIVDHAFGVAAWNCERPFDLAGEL